MYGAGATWSRLFLPGAGDDQTWSELESAPGPRTFGAGAAQNSDGSATLTESLHQVLDSEMDRARFFQGGLETDLHYKAVLWIQIH